MTQISLFFSTNVTINNELFSILKLEFGTLMIIDHLYLNYYFDIGIEVLLFSVLYCYYKLVTVGTFVTRE